MRKLLGAALMLVLWAPVAAFGGSIVIDFDDLVGSGPVPDGYGGVADWGGWTYYDAPQPPYNPHSPPCRVYDNTNGMFDFGSDVVFEGAWFAGYGTGDGFSVVYFELYDDDGLVHTSGSVDPSATPQWLGSGYAGLVDEVRVVGYYGFFVMDDVQYIPEPASLGLLTLGGLALLRRR